MSMIIDPSYLEEFLDNAKAAVEECKCQLDDDGLHIVAVDPANVLMIDQTLDAGAFESYDVSDTDIRTVGFNIKTFQDVLSLAGGDDVVDLSIDTDGRYTFRIQSQTLDHSMSLIDPNDIRPKPEIPDLDEELRVRAVFEGSELKRMYNASNLVSKHISLGINAEDETFVGTASGDNDSTKVELSRQDLIDLEIDAPGDVRSLFSTEYLNKMTTAIGDSELEVQVDEDMPMTFDFGFADGHGDARYVFAPRLET